MIDSIGNIVWKIHSHFNLSATKLKLILKLKFLYKLILYFILLKNLFKNILNIYSKNYFHPLVNFTKYSAALGNFSIMSKAASFKFPFIKIF